MMIIMVLLLWTQLEQCLGPPKRGAIKPMVSISFVQMCLLVWDSGLQLIDEN